SLHSVQLPDSILHLAGRQEWGDAPLRRRPYDVNALQSEEPRCGEELEENDHAADGQQREQNRADRASRRPRTIFLPHTRKQRGLPWIAAPRSLFPRRLLPRDGSGSAPLWRAGLGGASRTRLLLRLALFFDLRGIIFLLAFLFLFLFRLRFG